MTLYKNISNRELPTHLRASYEENGDNPKQEQPKFNVGDLVVSKKNPHLTYKILATNIPNKLGKTNYKVEIFTDGKPGLLDEPHNIHLISSDKIEDCGELVQQEQLSEDLEVRKQIEELANDWHHKGFASDEDCPLCMQDLIDILWYFYELGKVLNARKEE